MSSRAPIPSLAGLLVALLAALFCCHAGAEARVPPELQVRLVSRLATFDRNFVPRAGPVAHVLIVRKSGSSASRFDATGFAKAVGERSEIGGIRAKVEEIEFEGPAALAARCRSQKVAVAYFSVGLEQEMAQVGAALSGVDVLTVGASARHAENGAVVGFDIEEARPKLVVNVKRAKAQNVSFKAEVLKLARIVD